MEILLVSSFTTSSARVSEFDSRNVFYSKVKFLTEKRELIKHQNGKYLKKIQLYLLLIEISFLHKLHIDEENTYY